MIQVSPLDAASLVFRAKYVSTLPIPARHRFISAQSATYFDGDSLHVWYGSTLPRVEKDELYYVRSADFINWSTPTKVISLLPLESIRDPTQIVDKGKIYLFCQVYNMGLGSYNRVALYSIPIKANYALPANYTFVGNPISRGGGGSFDAWMAASPTARKIGTEYYLVYEACDVRHGIQTIGKASTSDLEQVPYARLGPLLDQNQAALVVPENMHTQLVPDTYFNDSILYVHYNGPALAEHWNVGIVYHPTESFASPYGFTIYLDNVSQSRPKSIAPSGQQMIPAAYDWATIGTVGIVGRYFYFLIQGWNTGGGFPWITDPSLYLMRTPLTHVPPEHK